MVVRIASRLSMLLHVCATMMVMSTTTVRISADDQEILDESAPLYGSRSNAIRQALRSLAGDRRRHLALESFLDAWNAEAGPVDEQAVAAAERRYGL